MNAKESRLSWILSASKILITDIFFKLLKVERVILIKLIQASQKRLDTIEHSVFSRNGEVPEISHENSISEIEINEILKEIRTEKNR